MIIKVCGITQKTKGLENLSATHLGFIFYKNSPRNAYDCTEEFISKQGEDFETVGVFVNEPLKDIINICNKTKIKTVQLHGSETPEDCRQLKKEGFRVIKALSIEPGNMVCDLSKEAEIYHMADNILFDCKGKNAGGNGIKFNWDLLFNYDEGLPPYILSGGIGIEDAEEVVSIMRHHPSGFNGIDLNSRFEISPGKKNIELINRFINLITA